jgi:HlyD family secretion protein
MSIRSFFTKKKIIWSIIILLVVGGIVFFVVRSRNNKSNILTATVTQQNLEETVLTTGQVVSATDLSLSFQSSGMVKKISVITGSQVKTGDVLATLDQANAVSSLTSARGQLAQANASYQKIITGASPDQINVSQKAVDTAQVAYNNALSQLTDVQSSTAATISQAQSALDDLQSPTTVSDNKRSAIVVAIANQLAGVKSDLDKEGLILDDKNLEHLFGVSDSFSLISFKGAEAQVQPLLSIANASLASARAYKSDSNISKAVSDALSALNQNVSSLNYCYTALQNTITSAQFTQTQLDAYKTSVNSMLLSENAGITSINSSRQALTDSLTAATNAVANSKLSATSQITSAQNQINSALASLHQAQANLAQLKAKAQLADIAAARAQVLSAQGQYQAAQSAFDNTIIKAPADGTITAVNTKVGQLASALQPVFVLQNINALHAEAYVSESNVASLQIGQSVDYTFDALGPDKHFSGKVLTIDPASTVISGVVDYLVKTSLPNIPEVKSGMTANMTILVATRANVLAVTSDAIINQNGLQYVRVVDDPKKKTYHQVEVTTGLQADGGLVEILSGLSNGQEIVTLIQ